MRPSVAVLDSAPEARTFVVTLLTAPFDPRSGAGSNSDAGPPPRLCYSRRAYGLSAGVPPPLGDRRILVCGSPGDRRARSNRKTMSQRCDLCQKGPMTGNNVSHSKRHTRRRFLPNLHAATVTVNGREVKARLCTRCIRTQAKPAR